MSKWEQNAVFEYSEYICLVKRINGIIAHKTIESELVRCKECKFRNVTEHGKQSYEDYCRWHPWESPDDDDFCSYGEREESNVK